MLLPNYKKLWKPYSTNGCSLERTIVWARKKSGASDEIMGSAVRSLFVELAGGRQFPKDGCDPGVCQCGMTNAHTAINHYFLRELLKLKSDMDMRYWQVLETMHHNEIVKFVEAENAAYIKKKMTPWYRKIFKG